MNSVTVAKRQRLAAGAAMLQDYNRSGLRIGDWLRQNNISKDKFYYWRNKLRDICLDELNSSDAAMGPAFVEIPTADPATSADPVTAATVCIRGCEFRLYETVSASFLKKLIEASAYAD